MWLPCPYVAQGFELGRKGSAWSWMKPECTKGEPGQPCCLSEDTATCVSVSGWLARQEDTRGKRRTSLRGNRLPNQCTAQHQKGEQDFPSRKAAPWVGKGSFCVGCFLWAQNVESVRLQAAGWWYPETVRGLWVVASDLVYSMLSEAGTLLLDQERHSKPVFLKNKQTNKPDLFIFTCLGVFLSVNVCAPCVCLCQGQKGVSASLNWSCRWLWIIMCALGIQLGCSALLPFKLSLQPVLSSYSF